MSKQLHVDASHLLRSSVGTDLSCPPPALFTLLGGLLAIWGLLEHSEAAGARLGAQHRFLKASWLITWTLGRVLKSCKINCPFFLRKRCNNICLLILLDIKRTMLFHALYQSEDKGCHVLFQIPTHYNSLTNTRGGDEDICPCERQILSWDLFCLLFHKKFMQVCKQP